MQNRKKDILMFVGCILVLIVAAVVGQVVKNKDRETFGQAEISDIQKEKEKEQEKEKEKKTDEGKIVVIDSGHGGFDPGKVSCIEGVLEKDVNLQIAKRLEKRLLKEGFTVVMTRKEDTALCRDDSTHKKREDMAERIVRINESHALLAVSIHQNSFTQQSQKGAQVFYFKDSREGKLLAEKIQKSIKDSLKDGNRREAKDNQSYYLLRHTKCPTVIVECGFLSNPEETGKLLNADYQEEIADAIKNGILSYCSESESKDQGNASEIRKEDSQSTKEGCERERKIP